MRALLVLIGLLTASLAMPPSHAAFPGERGLIVYSSATRIDDGQIFTVSEDGSDVRQLTDQGDNRGPAWSPDGRLTWACDGDICISDGDGSNVEKLTGLPDEERQPSWSPDGRWIVFTRALDPQPYRYASGSIFKIEVADPENVVQLTHVDSNDPEWSPYGERILFLRGGVHAGELWSMRPDGRDERLVTDRYAQAATPSWSPNGRRIAMMAKRRNMWRVVVLTRRGRVVREFGFERAMALGISWSPDGRRLVFVGAKPNSQEDLFVTRPNGSRSRLLGVKGRTPDWQPR